MIYTTLLQVRQQNLLVVHVVELNRVGVIISCVALLEALPDASHSPASDTDVSTEERQNQNLKRDWDCNLT